MNAREARDLAAALSDAKDQIKEIGETSKATAKESSAAFHEIGQMAQSQVGHLATGAFDVFNSALQKAVLHH